MRVDQSELAAEIRRMQATGVMSDALARMVYQMAGYLHSTAFPRADPDDFRQQCVLLVLAGGERIDASASPFNYLLSVFRSAGVTAWRKRQKERVKRLGLALNVRPEVAKAVLTGKPARPPEPKAGRPPKTVRYRGREYTVPQLAGEFGVSKAGLRLMLVAAGWDADKLAPPPRYGFRGGEHTACELARLLGLNHNHVAKQLRRYGGDAEAAFPADRYPT